MPTRNQTIKQYLKDREQYAANLASLNLNQLRAEHQKMVATRSTRWMLTRAELDRRELAARSVTWRRGTPPNDAALIHTSVSEDDKPSSRYWLSQNGTRIWRESDHWQEVGPISGQNWRLAGRTSGTETGYTELARLVRTGCDWAQKLDLTRTLSHL